MIPRVKICGITSLDDAMAACDAGADALGFNFAEEAKPKGRYIDPDDAARIIAQLPPFVTTVAITVNETVERLREFLDVVQIVQLCGEETVETVNAVGDRAIRALRLGPGLALNQAVEGRRVRAFLLDAYVAGQRGGAGNVCDWGRARAFVAAGHRVILAGGLTPDNVADAVRAVSPYAVDVAGGVEESGGKKDHGKLRRFIRNARSALPVSG